APALGLPAEPHGTNPETPPQRPGGLVGVRVDHIDCFPANRAGHHVLAIRCDVGIVNSALGGDGLDALERNGVDHIDAPRCLDDSDVHLATVLTNRHVV